MRQAMAGPAGLFGTAALAALLCLSGHGAVALNSACAAEAPSNAKAGPMEFLKEPRALPDVQFLDGQGRAVTLSDFHGKVVLLNVWATWCPPCRDEMPSLDRLQAKLGGPDFEVVALSIDEGGPFAVRSFYDELGLEALAVYIDQTVRAADKLGTPGLPTTFLVDRQGRVVATAVGPEEWDSQPVVAMIRRVSRTR